MSDRLAEICARKAEHVASQKYAHSLQYWEEHIDERDEPRGFELALRQRSAHGVALIAEIKKASPSKGIIRADFNPIQHAQDYYKAGATCLSVLTDAPYFQGNDTYLAVAREACPLPALRKDFMIDPYQITESRALGADCILIIMAALSNTQAQDLEAAAHAYGMDVLIEVHDREEKDRALTHLNSKLLGINNRNLKTLEVSLETGKLLADGIPDDYLLVCESGIASHAEVEEMRGHGFGAFLVGESLMRQDDLVSATRSLLEG